MGLWHFLAWMVWGLVNPAFAFSMYEKPLSIRMPTAFDQGNTTVAVTTNISAPHCAALHPLHHGSFYVEAGSGTSLGSVLTFWCNEGYQLVGSEKVTCIVKEGAPQWSNYLPACEVIPKPVDRGLRVAVLVSVISGIVILSMSASFIACCVRERLQRARDRRRDSSSGTFFPYCTRLQGCSILMGECSQKADCNSPCDIRKVAKACEEEHAGASEKREPRKPAESAVTRTVF
ncbi:sushi domain-containing protein 3 isoform X3 [Acipenser ruthenus]|uniref:sushi domain-containing protein 3 isoform X3 n=1 Tax=Acipenser ruthenus TaxID=7906 RepID=UPI00274224A7|nr:sushi domain-containing protein 3 isoform X3 [Acipenser ruthenus]